MARLPALLFVAALAGCSRHAESPAPPQPAAVPAAAPTPTPAAAPTAPPVQAESETDRVDAALARALMVAIFGGDYDPAKKIARATIAEGENAGPWLMTLYDTRELADGRMVAVVNGAPSDKDGEDLAAHASPGMLNVFYLKRDGERWTVLARHLDVATMGSHGSIGDTQWIELGPGKPALIVLSGGTWQGQSIAGADIFDLAGDVRHLGNFDVMSTNGGACAPDTDDCWDVEGKIGTADATPPAGYRDIVVDFTDKRYRVTEDAKGDFVEHPKSTSRTSARYRFDGKQYVLAEGSNPVPGI